MYLDLWKNGVFYNLSLLLATGWAVYYAITPLMAGQECTITRLLASVAFPPLLHICYLTLTVNWVPVAYILKPPHYPNRSSSLPAENGKSASHVETKREATSESRWPAVDKVGKEILHLGTRLEIQERPEL